MPPTWNRLVHRSRQIGNHDGFVKRATRISGGEKCVTGIISLLKKPSDTDSWGTSCLSPPFVTAFRSATDRRAPVAIKASQRVFTAINSFRQEVSNSITMVETTIVPPVAAAILRRAKEPRYVAEVTMEMRGSRRARAFRKWCSEFAQAIETGDVATQQKKWHALEEAAAKWKVDLDEEVRYRKRSLKFGMGILFAKADADFSSIHDPVLLPAGRLRPLLLLNDVFRVK